MTKYEKGWLTRNAKRTGLSAAEYQRYIDAGYKCCMKCCRWKKANRREFKPDPKGAFALTGTCRECLKPHYATLGRDAYRRKNPVVKKKRYGPLPPLPPMPYEPPQLPGTAYARRLANNPF